MAIVVKKTSQVVVHMAIAFAVMFVLTGSVVFGGLAAVLEPVINVLLLPLHQRAWKALRGRARHVNHERRLWGLEKVSQVGLHLSVGFAVMYAATASLAMGGLGALMEPICAVIAMPFYERFWDRMQQRWVTRAAAA